MGIGSDPDPVSGPVGRVGAGNPGWGGRAARGRGLGGPGLWNGRATSAFPPAPRGPAAAAGDRSVRSRTPGPGPPPRARPPGAPAGGRPRPPPGPFVLVVRGVQGQDQGPLCPGLSRAGCPQGPHPAQQLREAGRRVHLRRRSPGQNAVGIVTGPLPQFPAHRLEVPVRLQGRGHRILAAVVGQQHALHPQGQALAQTRRDRGQVPLELATQRIQ